MTDHRTIEQEVPIDWGKWKAEVLAAGFHPKAVDCPFDVILEFILSYEPEFYE